MIDFYHGSVKENLLKLDVISKCNENPEIKCAYITNNYAYSLLYIRDMDINIVTAWVGDDGIVYYEEQFKNQLKILYDGLSGFVYHCNDNNFIKSNTNGIYYSTSQIYFDRLEKIDNVYKKINEEIKKGNIIVKKFKDITNERKTFLYRGIANKIIKNNFFKNNKKLRDFYFKYYRVAWKMAVKQSNTHSKNHLD